MSWLSLLSALILFQIGLMALFLFTSKRGKILSNRLLAFFFLLLLFNIIDGLLSYTGWYTIHPRLAGIEDGFILLFGPIIYLHTRSVIYRDFRWESRYWLHGIPSALVIVAYQLLYRTQSENYQEFIQNAITSQTLPPAFYFTVSIFYLQVAVYLLASWRQIVKYRVQIRNQFSNISEINLEWLTFMHLSICGLLLVSLVNTFLPVLGLQEFFPLGFSITLVLLFVFSSLVVWKGLRQPEIFYGINDDSSSSEKKYANPLLSETEMTQLVSRLTNLMKKEKPYLEPALSLDQLASMLDTVPKKLSQTINDKLGQNFFTMVNTYRIDEAMQLIRETKDPGITILEIMYQCGFNSKSSFNTLFREKTGMTPTDFKKQVRSI